MRWPTAFGGDRRPIIRWAVLALVVGSLAFMKGSGAGPSEYRPYALEWVAHGPPGSNPAFVRQSDGTLDMAVIRAGSNLYYTNNRIAQEEEQGWLPYEQVSVTERPFVFGYLYDDWNPIHELGDPTNNKYDVAIDADGGVHVVWVTDSHWEEYREYGYGEPRNALDQFRPTRNLWYRYRNPQGVWGPERNITGYTAFQFFQDPYPCTNIPLEEGREWWWRRAVTWEAKFAVESTGTPRFAWRQADQYAAFNSKTGQECENQDFPPSPPPEHSFDRGLLTQYGAEGPPDDTFFDIYDRPVSNLTIDHTNTAHLFLSNASGSRYVTAPAGGGWGIPVNPFVGAVGSVRDVVVDEDNTLHVLFSKLFTDTSSYYRRRGALWEGPDTLPLKVFRFAVNRDDPPFILGAIPSRSSFSTSDGRIYTRGNDTGEWYEIDSISNLYFLSVDFAVTDDSRLLDSSGGPLSMSTIFNGDGTGESSYSIGPGTSMNTTNGDLSVAMPIAAMAGVGPDSSLELLYDTLGGAPLHPVPSANWRLHPGPRVLITDHGSPAIVLGTGEVVRFSYQSENFAEALNGRFLRLEHFPTTGEWELEEADGQRTHFLKSGQISWTKDSSGNQLTYTYGDNPQFPGNQENLQSIRNVVTQQQTTFEYDISNNLIQIQDPQGRSSTLEYYNHEYAPGEGGAEQRLLKSVTNPEGEKWEFTYHNRTDDDPKLTCPSKRAYLETLKDPKGNVTTFCYEIGGRLKKAINAELKEMMFSYDNLAP